MKSLSNYRVFPKWADVSEDEHLTLLEVCRCLAAVYSSHVSQQNGEPQATPENVDAMHHRAFNDLGSEARAELDRQGGPPDLASYLPRYFRKTWGNI
jgi:hypothetical protein